MAAVASPLAQRHVYGGGNRRPDTLKPPSSGELFERWNRLAARRHEVFSAWWKYKTDDLRIAHSQASLEAHNAFLEWTGQDGPAATEITEESDDDE